MQAEVVTARRVRLPKGLYDTRGLMIELRDKRTDLLWYSRSSVYGCSCQGAPAFGLKGTALGLFVSRGRDDAYQNRVAP